MDADNSLDNVNATGAWSFDLKGKAPEQMKLYLIQKEDVVRESYIMEMERRRPQPAAQYQRRIRA
jgi:hypothetical protein